jgi:protein lifeguard
MSASQYTEPPPSYQSKQSDIEETRPPPLSDSLRAGASGGAIYDQPKFGDLPDDFKHGVTIWGSSPEIQHASARKILSFLCACPTTQEHPELGADL